MGDGVLGIVLIGETTGEDHVGGHSVALGKTVDIFMRFGGMHVVDAQIEGRADFKFGQHAQGRHAAGSIHQRCQRTAVDHASLRVANDLRAVRQDDR
ncbi:hypothetical protein D3C85_1608420 [compost metagenome]